MKNRSNTGPMALLTACLLGMVLAGSGVASAPPPDRGSRSPGDYIDQFSHLWGGSGCGLVYDGGMDVWYSHLLEPEPSLFTVDRSPGHTLTGTLDLSALNPGWSPALNSHRGIGYDPSTDTFFLTDPDGGAGRSDNIIEVDRSGTILNAWELGGDGNDSYDGSSFGAINDVAVVPGEPTRFFVTERYSYARFYEIDLIRTGSWWTPGSWGTVATLTSTDFIMNTGIDYDHQHGLLYHCEEDQDVVWITDLGGTTLDAVYCPYMVGLPKTGVTYLEGSDPPELWLTSGTANQTICCESAVFPTVTPNPSPTPTPPNVIETFPNAWNSSGMGLVFVPGADFVRYVHEPPAGETIFDINYWPPHDVIGAGSLSAINPGWPVELDPSNGIGIDLQHGTFLLTDFLGAEGFLDDHILEIDGAGVIQGGWETDGPDNDSADGTEIDGIWDIAAVPGSPPRYFATAGEGASIVYEIHLVRTGEVFVPESWYTVAAWAVPGLTDNLGIDFDELHGVLYHSDFHSNLVVATDLDGNLTCLTDCPSLLGSNSGITAIEGSAPPELWVTDFQSDRTTRCLACDLPTVTPIPSWTPETPTPTPDPPSPTPDPSTPTPEPSPPSLGVRIDMPAMAHPGETFWVTGLLDNPGAPRESLPVFFILAVAEDYWFWPSWTHFAPPEHGTIDFDRQDVPTGTTPLQVIPELTWPDTDSDQGTGLLLYGAFVSQDLTEIEGDWAVVEWGYGPER